MSDRRSKASDFPKEVLTLFDRYVHGMIDRRGFLEGAGRFAVGSMTAAAMLEGLSPRYAQAQQVSPDDERIVTERIEYASPDGAGTMGGYLARPAGDGAKPAILVIHENRGLNPYVEDVVRRFAAADFLAFGPDALFPLGGYPGNDDEGRTLQRQRDRDDMLEDFVAAFELLRTHERSTGRVGAVGFCFGGGVVNYLATRLPDLGAGVPFYGSQPEAEDVARIQAPLMIQNAGLDERVNAGWPAYMEALEANDKTYTVHVYEDVNHGFHNDTTPRFDPEAAKLAEERTIAFFNEHLR
jgi:carboxymethylenebutenolidase